MKILMLVLISITYLINLVLNLLFFKTKNEKIPESVSDVYDEDEYLNFLNYQSDNFKVSIFKLSVGYLLTMILFSFNIHYYLFNFVEQISDNLFVQITLIISMLSLLNLIVNVGFEYYDTFKIEEKYGFNKSTKNLFLRDLIIKFVFGVLLQTVILFFLNKVYLSFNDVYMFLITSLVVTFTIILIIPILYPLFVKLFNKLTELEDGSLKEKIINYAQKVKFPISNIYVIDASKRSSKGNAFFIGYGKNRKIVLYDTLINDLKEEEIVAILAHEAGHAKFKHSLKLMPLSLLSVSVTLVTLFFFVGSNNISTSFNFSSANFLFGSLLFFEVFLLISNFLNMFSNHFSRKFEYQADNYVKETYEKNYLISALKSLTKKNLSNLLYHPVIVLIKGSHPTLHKRIENLNK